MQQLFFSSWQTDTLYFVGGKKLCFGVEEYCTVFYQFFLFAF